MPIRFDDESPPAAVAAPARSRIAFDDESQAAAPFEQPIAPGGGPQNGRKYITKETRREQKKQQVADEFSMGHDLGAEMAGAKITAGLASSAPAELAGLSTEVGGRIRRLLGGGGDPVADRRAATERFTYAPPEMEQLKPLAESGPARFLGGVTEAVGNEKRRFEGVPVLEDLYAAPFLAGEALLNFGGAGAVRAPTSAARRVIRESTELMGARTPEEVARAAGFQVRPSDIEAAGGTTSRTQRTAERIGGGGELRRDAILNQLDRTDALAREEMGIPEGTPINAQSLAAVEAPHAAAYNVIEAIPQVGFDPAFAQRVAAIGSGNPLTATTPAIRALQEEILANQGASGLHIRQKISDLRQLARDNLATGGGEQVAPRDRTLGRAQLDMANAMEELLERNIPPEQLAAYRDARRVFAQTNMLRRANTLGDRIDPTVIRDEARTNPAIQGRFRIIADAAERYPKVFAGAVPEMSAGQGAGMLARMGSGAAVGATGGGALFGLPGAVGGAIGGLGAPWAARRLLGPGSPVADIEAGAPLYFRRPETPTQRQPLSPPNMGPPQPEPPFTPWAGPLEVAPDAPPGFFSGNPRIKSQESRALDLWDPEGTVNPQFQLEGQPYGAGPLQAFEGDLLPWEIPTDVPPLQGPRSDFASQLGPVQPRLGEMLDQPPGIPGRPRGVTGPFSAQLSDPRLPRGLRLLDDQGPLPPQGPDFGPGDEFPGPTDSVAEMLYRGVPEGADPFAPNERGFTTWSNQRPTAEFYGPNVGEMPFDPSTNAHLGQLEEARQLLGLGPDATAQDIAAAAMRRFGGANRTASYDLRPELNGTPREFISFGDLLGQ